MDKQIGSISRSQSKAVEPTTRRYIQERLGNRKVVCTAELNKIEMRGHIFSPVGMLLRCPLKSFSSAQYSGGVSQVVVISPNTNISTVGKSPVRAAAQATLWVYFSDALSKNYFKGFYLHIYDTERIHAFHRSHTPCLQQALAGKIRYGFPRVARSVFSR